MKTLNKFALVGLGLIGVAGMRWSLLRATEGAPAVQAFAVTESETTAGTANGARPVAVAPKGDELEAEKMKTLAAIHRDPTIAHKKAFAANEPFAYAHEVSTYGKLRAKVFLKAQDKAAKREMFANRDLIDGIGEFLKHASKSDYYAQVQQTTAIDLLLEAAKSPEGREAAEAALQGIIADNQIEGEAIPMDARKNLAGVKAEVLFQWSAQDPTKTKSMQAWLPGPVSQKIWENVTDAQTRNLRESAMVGGDDAD